MGEPLTEVITRLVPTKNAAKIAKRTSREALNVGL
jgi:hypothetical protein